MNSRERFEAAIRGYKPDRTPTAHVSALTTVELQEMTDCFMPDVHLAPQKLAKLCYANHEILGFDAVTFLINYFNEPAALGAAINWGDQKTLPMYSSHPWQKPQDAVIPNNLLDATPIRTSLETIRIADKQYGQHIAVLGKIMGPFSMVQVMHGIENVMMAAIEQPDTIRHFLKVASAILVKSANAQLEAGAIAIAIGEGGAGANMISPDMYRHLLLDIHKDIISQINGPTIMHICGDITPRLSLLKQIGLSCFNFDSSIVPKVIKKTADNKFRIMGNINTADLLNGRPEDIEKQVITNLEAGTDIISPGCAVSPLCPNRNLQTLQKAIQNWRPQSLEKF